MKVSSKIRFSIFKAGYRVFGIVGIIIIIVAGSIVNIGTVEASGIYKGHTYPNTCVDVHSKDPNAIDGQYTILSNGRLLDVFCKDLSTDPSEYITLVNTQGNYNFSSYVFGGHNSGLGVRTYFTKVRLNPETLAITTNDYIYDSYDTAQNINLEQVWHKIPYGDARGCSDNGSHSGQANINLQGTVFTVEADQFYTQGSGAVGTSNYASSVQIVDITSGGNCGSITMGSSENNYKGVQPTKRAKRTLSDYARTNVGFSVR